MRTQLNTAKSRSNFVYRFYIFCLASVAISASSFATAANPVALPPPGPVTISLQQFSVTYVGNNQWHAEGVVQAQNPTQVTAQFSGASNKTTTPNSGGYFSIVFNATPNQYLWVAVTDSTGTANGEKYLQNYSL